MSEQAGTETTPWQESGEDYGTALGTGAREAAEEDVLLERELGSTPEAPLQPVLGSGEVVTPDQVLANDGVAVDNDDNDEE